LPRSPFSVDPRVKPVYSATMQVRFSGWATHRVGLIGLAVTSFVAASCNSGARRATYQPPYAPPPVAYIDQRAPGGYMPPLRPPPVMRPPPTGPTLLSGLGPGFVQGFFGAPLGNSPLPTIPPIPFPWPFGTAPAGIPGVFPVPPPQVNQVASGPGCGEVIVAGVAIPMDCMMPGYGDIPWAARAVLPDSIFRLSPAHAGAAALPQSVDHRAEGLEGPVRNQGSVGACTAFSFAAAVDHALARNAGRPGFVSAMHVWSRYHTPNMAKAAEGNRQKPLTAEESWQYTGPNSDLACSWVDTFRCKPYCETSGSCTCKMPATSCGKPVDPEAINQADGRAVARVTTVTRIEMDKATIMATLAKGQDIWMAMSCNSVAFGKLSPQDGLPAVIPDFNPSSAKSGHAMVIAGYRVTANGAYFLLHNSWSKQWGDDGYAWIHESTLMKNFNSAYTVDAEPIGPSKVPPRNENPTQCPEGLLPDSITAQCAPACPDGSARHNAACADSSQCPQGYVNLSGECVVAAPTARGMDPGTNVRYNCAPGGCSYVVPFGFGGCFLPWCTVSCPSPRFRLSTDTVTMACSE
jgi:hypothetical protein